MDDKLKTTIDKVVKLTEQNKEFNTELRKRLEISSANSVVIEDSKMDQIYELCIKKILHDQAKDFYKDFPDKSILPILEQDFVRMEAFKREGNFGDFSLALYQQIECISNKICESKVFADITEKMWGYPAYVKNEIGKELNLAERADSDYTIAALVFPGINRTTHLPNSVEKSKKALQSQYAIDKIRTIVYFFGYRAKMRNSDYENFVEITNTLSDIYKCRNMNHRGNTLTEYEVETIQRVKTMESHYYYKFTGALAQFITFIISGSTEIEKLRNYAITLTQKKVIVSGPQPIGKIDLKDDGRKRFK